MQNSKGGASMMTLLAAAAMAGSPMAPALADDVPKVAPVASAGGDLTSFADALGVQLGTGRDQEVFDAAARAMKASPHGLYVKVPPGIYRLRHIRFGANSGYYAEAPQTVILQQIRDEADAADDIFIALDDPTATNWLFWGFILDGGWTYGRGAYRTAPEKDPWLDHQHAVSFSSAYAGPADWDYRRKSPIGSQNPRGRYGELLIANFAGDGLRAAGSGAQTVSALQITNVGGRGMVWTTYDNNAAMIDIGGTGREGFYCGVNCASNRFSDLKIWYSGIRRLPGAGAALVIDRGGSNRFSNVQLQDSAGDAVILDRAKDNTLDVGVQWQGEIPWMDAPVAALMLRSDAQGNLVRMNISMTYYAAKSYPAVRYALRALKGDQGTRAGQNQIDLMIHDVPAGSARIMGPIAASNRIVVNGATYTHAER